MAHSGLEPGLPLGLQRVTDPCWWQRSISTGIPSGRSFARFDAFGMYTRRTGGGFHDVMDWCTCTAISALASEVKATSPSIPAVLRPVLRCVTCRTLPID